jgi:hypothetical protein
MRRFSRFEGHSSASPEYAAHRLLKPKSGADPWVVLYNLYIVFGGENLTMATNVSERSPAKEDPISTQRVNLRVCVPENRSPLVKYSTVPGTKYLFRLPNLSGKVNSRSQFAWMCSRLQEPLSKGLRRALFTLRKV